MSDGFTLRASPFAGLGGMYATGQGEGKPLIVSRLGLEHQHWVKAQPNDASGDAAVVIRSKDNPKLTWKYTKPREPITLADTDEPSLWHIKSVRHEDGQEIIQIVAQTGLLGSDWYVDTNDDNEVIITAIPVSPQSPPGPVWKKYS